MSVRAHVGVLAAAAAAAVVAGCGGGGGSTAATTARSAAGTTTQPATTSASPGTAADDVARGNPGSKPADAATTVKVQSVANAYATAIGRRDWAAVCATRAPAERRSIAKDGGGTCAGAMSLVFSGRPVETIGRLRAGAVFTRHGRASVQLALPGERPAMKVVAEPVGGRWYLVDVPDAEAP
jgi:hypothetical protein